VYERFTDRARKVMQLANQEAQRSNHEYIGTEHILLGLVQEGSGVAANVLKNLDVDLRRIRPEVERTVTPGPTGEDPSPIGRRPQEPRAKKVIEYSIEEARNLDHNYVGTGHLLLGLLREEEGVAAKVLMNLGLKLEDVREEVLNLSGHDQLPNEDEPGGGSGGERTSAGQQKSKTPALDSFGRDLTELARQGKLDPVIGRASELTRVLQVLGCRNWNCPLLIGEARVGKTAIVEGLAQLLTDNAVPRTLQDRRLIALDLAQLAAGAKGRSEIEDRARAVLTEVRKSRNTILAFDPLLLRASSEDDEGAVCAWRVLRPALTRGELQCVATVTLDLKTKDLVQDDALRRLFQVIRITPPTREESIVVLRGLRDRLEAHHRVQITDAALEAAVEWSDRYVADRCLPNRAINVLDEACALLRLKAMTRPPDLKDIDEEIEKLNQEKEATVAEQDFEKAAALRDQADKLKKKKDAATKEWREKIKEIDGVVEEGVFPEVISRMTGIPIGRLVAQGLRPPALPTGLGYSAFISYSGQDEDFAKKLHERLVASGLRVWFAPENMKAGEVLADQIGTAIERHDKLLLVLSENSLRSDWVMTEIRKALKTERATGQRKLFPIRLVAMKELFDWECIDPRSGQDLADEVCKYFIPDFTDWRDGPSFEAAVARLLKDLALERADSED
jgi:ATP-dependent Clp protease ATP-binding subunit ClpC